MLYQFRAMTNSTMHLFFEKEFKSELALKRYLNKMLRQYEPDAYFLVRRGEHKSTYRLKQDFFYWDVA